MKTSAPWFFRLQQGPVLWYAALAGVLIAAAFFVVREARAVQHVKDGDWWVYFRAGQALREKCSPYNPEDKPALTFKNAPCVALSVAPLTFLPPEVARGLWCTLDAVLIGIILYLSACIVYPRRMPWPSAGWLALAALLLSTNNVTNQLHAGQTSSLWIALTLAAFLAMKRGRVQWAGVALAAAVCIKIVPICFVPYFLIVKKGRTGLLAFAASLAALLLLPALWVGWSNNLDMVRFWPEHLANTDRHWQSWRLQNQSVNAQLVRFLSPNPYGCNFLHLEFHTVHMIWLLLSVLTASLLYLYLWKSRNKLSRRASLHLALLLLFMTVFNPLAWRYNFIALLFPYYFVLTAIQRRVVHWKWVALLTACACVLGNIPMALPGVPVLQAISILGGRFWGAVLLGMAVIVAHRSQRRTQDQLDADLSQEPILQPAVSAVS